MSELLCISCIHTLLSFPQTQHLWLTALFHYKDPHIRKMIRHLKNHPSQEFLNSISTVVNDIMYEDISEHELFLPHQPILVIPIPLSKNSYKRRGYNQAKLLAETVARAHSLYVLHDGNLMHNGKQTTKQALIRNRTERKKNVRGTFSLREIELIRHQSILLVDDVTTTHATLEEARTTLLGAGAGRVSALTLAH